MTTIVRPADPELRAALRLAAIFAAALFLFHLLANLWQTHLTWGYFRDEFYYIACGRHLAWGYVDHGPLVAIQARLAETLFGHSLMGIRALSALAGSARVFLTGLLAWSLGGRRPSQSLAMFAVATAPQYLALDGFLSMNSAESLFWMSALLALILIIRASEAGKPNPRWWLLFGAASGLGLLNKPSMAFFLVALLAAILLTRRDLLRTPWALAGIALMLAIVAPYLHWQIANHWPTWEFLNNGRIQHKNKSLAPIPFLLTQFANLDPASALVWVPGLVFLLRRKPWRFLGLTYIFFLLGMMVLHAKDYYVVPIYPILFAAGGLAWEQRFAHRRLVMENRTFAFPAAIATLVLISLAVLPMDTPILTPAAWVHYAAVTHRYNAGSNSESADSGPLPQFYADRFGWQEEVDAITRAYNSLTPQEQAEACIWGSNYGEAGAVQFLAPHLSTVISGHNNYFLWGPHNCTGQVIISMTNTPAEELQQEYHQVAFITHLHNPWSMPNEHRNIVLLRGRIAPVAPDWPEIKHYD